MKLVIIVKIKKNYVTNNKDIFFSLVSNSILSILLKCLNEKICLEFLNLKNYVKLIVVSLQIKPQFSGKLRN